MDPQIKPLLILQDRDMKRLNLIASLEAVPVEVGKAQAEVAALKRRIEQSRQALLALQVRRKELAVSSEAAQEQVVRYKTQQLQVKKNEEYQALTHQIETTQNQVAELEDEELTLLMEIDEREQKFAAEQERLQAEIALLEREIASLREREQVLASERQAAEEAAAQSAAAVAPAYLEAYRRVGQRKARQPWVVMISEHKCGGCHLKLSGESESFARECERPVHCENCGRVVYWD